MKQEERRQKTMELLLQTVKKLIAESGCESITMKHIMEQSGLSKGAIFHYVDSKEELFAKVLEQRLDDIDERFARKAEESDQSAAGPLSQITARLPELEEGDEITNRVIAYLVGRAGIPAVNDILRRFYESSVQRSITWIEAGQRKGVLSADIDAAKTSELFVLISFGIRMRTVIGERTDHAFRTADYAALIGELLGIPTEKGEH
ncbi:hypothetical protein PAESOLCIP111_00975 [Paenibacillus solanacearum]|uniref:HTH tetR-type domain-containing protein n=1 Tax=Paenibacillus solanacearum TaxID=2048548 RepID=A0A916NH58_9BACL|nr:TetR/AcrR family transcriptional regulator [Paenibacillus solanacearum]CAG7607591.1 hypothetical protein PAESOLCIP111_00975 [Paenibacillus solanacearum]